MSYSNRFLATVQSWTPEQRHLQELRFRYREQIHRVVRGIVQDFEEPTLGNAAHRLSAEGVMVSDIPRLSMFVMERLNWLEPHLIRLHRIPLGAFKEWRRRYPRSANEVS